MCMSKCFFMIYNYKFLIRYIYNYVPKNGLINSKPYNLSLHIENIYYISYIQSLIS